MAEVAIPKLGWQMDDGVLVEWLVNDGDVVRAGSPIYVLETDKVENEVVAAVSGTISCIGKAGETYPVGYVVAEIAPH
jgi:pyruvate/2-oxoglutarate dehydrogenase complex dihydrolipoamide acyltransferase (E2) component